MATIPQIRTRLLEGFSEKQADILAHVVIEAHDDLVNRADFHELTCVVKQLAEAQTRTEARVEVLAASQERLAVAQERLAEAQMRTEARVEELTAAQQRLTEAQMRTEARVTELAAGQDRLTVAQDRLAVAQDRLTVAQDRLTVSQQQTEGTLAEVVKTQQKMLIRLDRLDGHMLESKVARNLPAFLGREFRKCRVLERATFVEELEGRLPEDDLADLMRADAIATARYRDATVHLVVETSCTAAADDLSRAARRAAALTRAGLTAIGVVACETISPQTLEEARRQGLRVLAGGWLLPDAA